MATANAWNIDLKDDRPRTSLSGLRIPELLVGLSIPLDSWLLLGGSANDLLTGALVILVYLTAVPKQTTRFLPFLAWGALVLWLAYVGSTGGAALDIRRLGHIAVWVLLIYALATARIHARSLILGCGIGLVLSAAYGVIFFRSSNYIGRMTGLSGDPNVMAFNLVVLGFVVASILPTIGRRRLWYLFMAGGVWLTLSRTGLGALAMGFAWLLLAARLSPLLATFAGVIGANRVESISTAWRQRGVFQDREGSDQLRERILAGEQAKIAQYPWTGGGPGSARVQVGGNEFFFHNSYYALRAEAGLVGLGLYIAAVVIVLWSLLVESTRRYYALEAAVLSTLVVANSLGEVLLAYPSAVAFGVALGRSRAHNREPEGGADGTPATTSPEAAPPSRRGPGAPRSTSGLSYV